MARRRSTSSASSVPELSLEDYDPRPDEELICVICHSVLHEPVECHCRHVFCRRCITEWVRKNNSCPVCRKRAIAAFMPALPLLQNMLSHLKVKCRNVGCNARVPRESYVSHVNTCEFHEVGCPHEACEHRCPRRALDSHVAQCPLRQVTCDQGCGLVLTKGRLQAHSCVDELKRKLDEASSERDDWKRKAEDATQALSSLHDTLRRMGSTVEGLQSNLGDLGSRLRCAETLAASGQRSSGRRPIAMSTPLRGGLANPYQGLLFGTRTARLLEGIESDSDRSWSPHSDASHESLRDVEELFLEDFNS